MHVATSLPQTISKQSDIFLLQFVWFDLFFYSEYTHKSNENINTKLRVTTIHISYTGAQINKIQQKTQMQGVTIVSDEPFQLILLWFQI